MISLFGLYRLLYILICECGLDILMMYLHTKNEVSRSRHSKVYRYKQTIAVSYLLNILYVWRKYAYFYNANEFYVFQQELLHSPNELLLVENCRYINGDMYAKPWLFQKINVNFVSFRCRQYANVCKLYEWLSVSARAVQQGQTLGA